MIECNAAYFSVASAFLGTYLPFHVIHIEPHSTGGVLFVSSDQGRVTLIAHDPTGSADESVNVIPDPQLLKIARPIKTAERRLTLEDSTATVLTLRKTNFEKKTSTFQRSTADFPPIRQALSRCLQAWDSELPVSEGRYDADYLLRIFNILAPLSEYCTFSSYDGGPLRIQTDSLDATVFLMPLNAAEPAPVARYLREYVSA
jgi:hypothetical protein